MTISSLRQTSIAIACSVFCCSGFAVADTITLISGESMAGKITFDAKNSVTITPKDQPAVRIELRNIIALKVDAANPAAASPGRVATLIDGTRIAAAEVLSLDDRELRLKRPDGSVLSVNAASARSVDFAPALPHDPPALTFVGAQLGDKDFTDGDVIAIAPGTVKISSVLFGVQDLDTTTSVRAVFLRPPGVSKAAYVLRVRDGSIWQATALAIDAGQLTATTELAGPISIAAADVLTIELGTAAADDLGVVVTSAADVLLTTGQPQTIAVAGKYRAVELMFRVPDTFMPTRSARLIVLADGKEVARSELVTSLDGPVTITRSIEQVKQLTFKLDATGPAALGIAGAISGGRLIHAQ